MPSAIRLYFPSVKTFFVLMVTAQAGLSEQQREVLTSALSLKGIRLPAYTSELAKECNCRTVLRAPAIAGESSMPR